MTHAQDITEAGRRLEGATPSEAARDEAYWTIVQRAFAVDRRIVNLNNGGVSAFSRDVLRALRRDLYLANRAPAFTLWQRREPIVEKVRSRLAERLGVGADEVAITRNASESLQTLLLGLDLARGDEVLTTDHDYPRFLTALRQRERREGIVVRTVPLSVPVRDPAGVVEAFRAGLTPRTRVLLVSHVLFTTGQVMPVRDVVALGRAHGVTVIVDGAHAVGQLPFRIPDLACDFYGSTLHKWTMGPHGTGLLFVRRDRIRDVWPLFAAPPERDGDIRKFEEIGTHASALHNALLAAFDVHDAVGVDHVRARLLYLRDRWVERVAAWPGVRLLTDLRPEVSCGLASVSIDGVPAADAVRALWRRRRILVVEMAHAGLNAIRVTPAVYTQVEEIDLFVDALERWLSRRRG